MKRSENLEHEDYINEPKKEKMLHLGNESWWKIILYCMSFFLIFFILAIVVGPLTGWIQNPSVRFAIT